VDWGHLLARWLWRCLAVAAVRRQDILARGTWLISTATPLFLFDKQISARFGVRGGGKRPSPLVMAGLVIPPFFCALYGCSVLGPEPDVGAARLSSPRLRDMRIGAGQKSRIFHRTTTRFNAAVTRH
jgi:hypothetical protein